MRRGIQLQLQLLRPYSSALNGNRSPVENVTKNTTAMLHQEDSSSRGTEEAFELRVPGEQPSVLESSMRAALQLLQVAAMHACTLPSM
jgi:hypothetical protein